MNSFQNKIIKKIQPNNFNNYNNNIAIIRTKTPNKQLMLKKNNIFFTNFEREKEILSMSNLFNSQTFLKNNNSNNLSNDSYLNNNNYNRKPLFTNSLKKLRNESYSLNNNNNNKCKENLKFNIKKLFKSSSISKKKLDKYCQIINQKTKTRNNSNKNNSKSRSKGKNHSHSKSKSNYILNYNIKTIPLNKLNIKKKNNKNIKNGLISNYTISSLNNNNNNNIINNKFLTDSERSTLINIENTIFNLLNISLNPQLIIKEIENICQKSINYISNLTPNLSFKDSQNGCSSTSIENNNNNNNLISNSNNYNYTNNSNNNITNSYSTNNNSNNNNNNNEMILISKLNQISEKFQKMEDENKQLKNYINKFGFEDIKFSLKTVQDEVNKLKEKNNKENNNNNNEINNNNNNNKNKENYNKNNNNNIIKKKKYPMKNISLNLNLIHKVNGIDENNSNSKRSKISENNDFQNDTIIKINNHNLQNSQEIFNNNNNNENNNNNNKKNNKIFTTAPNLNGLEKYKFQDFNEEFMSNYNEFSESWRKEADKLKLRQENYLKHKK